MTKNIAYAAETLMNALINLEEAFNKYKDDEDFNRELNYYHKQYTGRPSILYYAEKMTKDLGGELFGTGIIGALAAYPIAVYVMGKDAALFAYVLPFIISSAGGTVIAIFLVTALKQTHALDKFFGDEQ